MKIFDLPIETERLRLRRVRHDDFDALFPIHSDTDVCRYLPYEPRDEAKMREVMTVRVEKAELVVGEEPLYLAVELKETGDVVGEVLIFFIAVKKRDKPRLATCFRLTFRAKGMALKPRRHLWMRVSGT